MNYYLTAAIRTLAAIAQGHPEEIQIWTVAALANRLGLDVVMTHSGAEHSLEAIQVLGASFSDMVSERLDDEPGEQAVTLQSAAEVIEELINDLRRRGITTWKKNPSSFSQRKREPLL